MPSSYYLTQCSVIANEFFHGIHLGAISQVFLNLIRIMGSEITLFLTIATSPSGQRFDMQ